MEHPNVIREIDALIDSYNWESVHEDYHSTSTAQLLKDMLQTNHADRLSSLRQRIVNYYGTISNVTLVMTEILLQILENPRLQHKEWIFKLLYVIHLSEGNRHDITIKLYRLFLRAKSVLWGFLNHHRAEYRVWGTRLLVQFVDDAQSVTDWLLARLEREKSLYVISALLDSLGSLLSLRRSNRISEKTRQTVTMQAQRFLCHRAPLVRLASISLWMKIFKHQMPPPDIVNILVQSWNQISIPREDRAFVFWIVISGLLHQLRLRSEEKAFEINLCLLTRIDSYQLLDGVMEIAGMYRLSYRSSDHQERYIAFSRQQTRVLETLLERRPFWGNRKQVASSLVYYGLETTRVALSQQLKHARIIIRPDEFWEADETPNLISYPPVDR